MGNNEYWDEDDFENRMADDEDMEGENEMEFNDPGEWITIGQLVCCLDTGDEENEVKIQIVFPEEDWDNYDTVRVSSPLLIKFYNEWINCMGVEDGIIRVGLVA